MRFLVGIAVASLALCSTASAQHYYPRCEYRYPCYGAYPAYDVCSPCPNAYRPRCYDYDFPCYRDYDYPCPRDYAPRPDYYAQPPLPQRGYEPFNGGQGGQPPFAPNQQPFGQPPIAPNQQPFGQPTPNGTANGTAPFAPPQQQQQFQTPIPNSFR